MNILWNAYLVRWWIGNIKLGVRKRLGASRLIKTARWNWTAWWVCVGKEWSVAITNWNLCLTTTVSYGLIAKRLFGERYRTIWFLCKSPYFAYEGIGSSICTGETYHTNSYRVAFSNICHSRNSPRWCGSHFKIWALTVCCWTILIIKLTLINRTICIGRI